MGCYIKSSLSFARTNAASSFSHSYQLGSIDLYLNCIYKIMNKDNNKDDCNAIELESLLALA